MKKNTFIKKMVSAVLCMLIVIMAVPTVANAGETAAYSGQDWTGYTPISTPEELNDIRKDLKGKYYLTCDIVFDDSDFEEGGAFYNGGRGWLSIGRGEEVKDEYSFKGVFDGNGHSIKNLMIYDDKNSSRVVVGLFGINAGIIKNLTVTDSVIYSESEQYDPFNIYSNLGTGGIAGVNHEQIINCTFDGVITGFTWVGGICGQNHGDVIGCINSGTVLVNNEGGGIAGRLQSWNNREVTVSNCYNTGIVSYMPGGNDNFGRVGGICGLTQSNITTIVNCGNYGHVMGKTTGGIIGKDYVRVRKIEKCFNAGIVIGSGYVGGIAGYGYLIENCWNTGYIESSGRYGGGIAGYAYSVKYCFNAGDVCTYNDYGSFHVYAAGISAELSQAVQCYNVGWMYTYPTEGYWGFRGGMATEGITLSSLKSEYCYSIDIESNSVHDKKITTYLNEEQIYDKASYAGFDFENVWFMDESSEFPFPQLRDNPVTYAESIELKNVPEKKVYLNGEVPDISEMRVFANYTTGIDVEIYDWFAYMDEEAKGLVPVFVEWNGIIEEFNVLMTGKDKFVLGDVDGSGDVSSADSYIVKLMNSGMTSATDDMTMASDVNLDGEVNAMDSYLYKLYLAGHITSFE